MPFESIFDGRERRKHVRIGETLPVSFRLFDKNNPEPLCDWKDCLTHDISRGGICIRIEKIAEELRNKIISKKYVFEIRLDISMENRVSARGDICSVHIVGETVWNRFKKETLEVGLRFTEISPEDDKIISDYIIRKYIDKYGNV